MSHEILVSAEHVVKTYTSGTEQLEILKGLDFVIPRSSSVSITGQSGSGKSTLLNILGGLDHCDSGSIKVDGTEIFGLPESALTHYRSKQVGFIFQFHYLLKDFSALENVMLPAFIAGMKKKDALEKARALLADVNLEDRLHHFPSQLSGGERQRVAVARSVINDPELVLADEPTGNLDPGNSGMVAELLYSFAEKHRKTLVVVTHDEKLAQRANIQFVLEAGLLSTRNRGEA
ncbi:MAG: ABC transporter ATP-binding protein [Treponema sp.]|jgi:lipoprotein-releasing system ATP-binding protein|nr:ABC transporter ATP-binding protein [Treponema sp.]